MAADAPNTKSDPRQEVKASDNFESANAKIKNDSPTFASLLDTMSNSSRSGKDSSQMAREASSQSSESTRKLVAGNVLPQLILDSVDNKTDTKARDATAASKTSDNQKQSSDAKPETPKESVEPLLKKSNPDDAPRVDPALVTGNGFGYAVLSRDGVLTKFLVHPYRIERPESEETNESDGKEKGVDNKKENEKKGSDEDDEDKNADGSKINKDASNVVKQIIWEKPPTILEPKNDTKDGSGKSDPPQTDKPTKTGKVEMNYVNESNVMRVKSDGAEQLYFMPFDLKRNALITINKNSAGETAANLRPEWNRPFTEEQKEIGGRNVRLISFTGTKEQIAMLPLDAKQPPQAWAIMPLENKEQLEKAVGELNAWQKNLSPDALVERELKNQEAWRVTPNVKFASENERKLWRQSETVLRMAQISEPNTDKRASNGMINASLDGDFVMPYVRDMAYALVGMTQMGHLDEARKGLMSYFNAQPGKMQEETRGKDYQISVVRYKGDGSEEADRNEHNSPNVELDNWGLALWASAEYFHKTHDHSFLNEKTRNGNTVYESMRDKVVAPLLANLDKYGKGSIVTKDSSNWEDHQENKLHIAYTTITAIAGLRGFLKMADAMNDKETVEKVTKAVADLEKGFTGAFIKDRFVQGSLERSFKHKIDGAVIEAFNFDVVKDPEVIARTLKQLQELKEPPGGFRRVRGPVEYDKHEFLMIDFNMARLYFKLGKEAEGMKMLDRIIKKANMDNNQIPEIYVSKENNEFKGKVGAPEGAIPMVGYGAGAFIMSLEQREAYRKKQAHNGRH